MQKGRQPHFWEICRVRGFGCFAVEACLREAFHHPAFSVGETTFLKFEMPCFFVLHQIHLSCRSPNLGGGGVLDGSSMVGPHVGTGSFDCNS